MHYTRHGAKSGLGVTVSKSPILSTMANLNLLRAIREPLFFSWVTSCRNLTLSHFGRGFTMEPHRKFVSGIGKGHELKSNISTWRSVERSKLVGNIIVAKRQLCVWSVRMESPQFIYSEGFELRLPSCICWKNALKQIGINYKRNIATMNKIREQWI